MGQLRGSTLRKRFYAMKEYYMFTEGLSVWDTILSDSFTHIVGTKTNDIKQEQNVKERIGIKLT